MVDLGEPSGEYSFVSAAALPDGRIAAVGTYVAGGKTDALIAVIGNGGVEESLIYGTAPAANDVYNDAVAVAVFPDGDLLVAGSTDIPAFPGRRLAFHKLHSDLTFDPSWGFGGIQILTVPSGATLAAATFDESGRIVFAGSRNVDGTSIDDEFLVGRLTAAGSFDPTFSGDGWTSFNIAPNWLGRALALQRDGKIVVAGSGGFNVRFAVARLDTAGNLDPTFDGDGKATIDFNLFSPPDLEIGTSVAVDRFDRIVVGGWAKRGATVNENALVVGRLLPDGTPDTSFGAAQDGKYTIDVVGKRFEARGLAIPPSAEDRILLAVHHAPEVIGGLSVQQVSTLDRFGLGIDPTFNGGVTEVPWATEDSVVNTNGIVLANGRPVVLGSFFDPTDESFHASLARLAMSTIFRDDFETGDTRLWGP